MATTTRTASRRRTAPAAARTQDADRATLLLIGTTKGAFLAWSDGARKKWRFGDLHFRGESVYAVGFDGRAGRQRVFASTRSWQHGAVLRASDDFGTTWTAADRHSVRFPEGSGLELKHIWQVAPASDAEPDRLFLGVEPACLFESRDGGGEWSPVQGLLAHEHRPHWVPGGGGLCLHTIVVDPTDARRILVAISTGGVYRTDDGGATWQPRNVGVQATFRPDKHPEFGQCVHKVVRHPAMPGRLYLQNHWGVYRSDDWGDHWQDIGKGLPSDFGFSLAVHPRRAGTAYVVPIESDVFHCVPEAKLRVYRTRTAGRSWEALTRGLPQRGAWETILRDAMTTDDHREFGLYFGTRNGKLFASTDEGERWRTLADGLPPITCVRAASIARD
jgi:hypothetical protein